MRLTKLKIAGFKSFVEPTTVVFPSQLAGVVGPNGCGKSNIIDAVRWVLGESKASELRGESIQDVIFKGSGTRKEVGRASVELHFDNSAGRAAGQWSQYAEISVKRVLDREGNSNYYINNLHVRRRDVIDLFLGTGLGPRAYAIIGQGMISRIVEAKPDELRFFLEEAAGVTKYKERRKETEGRLEDARENLARVDDIRNELASQVERLTAQAEVARRYRDLQGALVRQQGLLWLKKRNDARDEAERLAQEIAASLNALEAETARLREIEARVEAAREAHFTASDALHAAQAEMYAANGEVKRLESELAHIRETRARLEARLAQIDAQLQHWREEAHRLADEALRWQALLDHARERAALAAARHEEAAAGLPAAEEAQRAAEAEVAAARQALNAAEQALRLAEAEQGHAQRALDALAQRRARLEAEQAALTAPDTAALAVAEAAENAAQARFEELQEEIAAWQERLPQLEEALRARRGHLTEVHQHLARLKAQREALAALQARVGPAGDLGAWLAALGLADAPPLWQAIEVEPGWETAVEAVLRERLLALPASREQWQRALANPPPQTVALAALAETAAETAPVPATPDPAAERAPRLRAKVRCRDARWEPVLDAWLGEVCIANEDTALFDEGMRINRAGHCATAAGLLLYVPDDRTHGVIERQREIAQLSEQCAAAEEGEALAQAALAEAEQALAAGQETLAALRREAQEVQTRRHAAHVELIKLRESRARFEARSAQIAADLAEITQQEEAERSARLAAAEEASAAQQALAAARQRMEAAQALLRERDTALRHARAVEHQLAREAQEAGFSERECRGKLDDNARARQQAAEQLARLQPERVSLDAELAGLSDVSAQAQLQAALALRSARESALAERRNALETAAAALRALDEERLRIEQGLAPARERINELKLKEQAARLNVEQYQARLDEAQLTESALTELAAALKPGLRDSALQSEITRLTREIEALGPVNLAALEELASAQERKGFLDEQSADLGTAIATLEDAIRRIDRATRAQLQETYDKVNANFAALFPELFGGGEAKLILTGDEILDAGVQIMAQPPGKRNSTIHLLSGGEKALTAIALVFALFSLNPAPFCMLDEVDAPLDDSNTIRFCEMVKRMSRVTQFIFITHNKITMEMAEQLIGVTMQEQGVSRVVEVDIEEALRMADKGETA